MKNNILITVFLFAITIVFSQEKSNTSVPIDSIKTSKDSSIATANHSKWFIEIGTGISNGSRPYTNGYYTNVNNQLFNSFILNSYLIGARYNFSEIVGLKMDVAFGRFINSKETKSKSFELAQYRTSLQAVFNLNSFVQPVNAVSRFNVLFHGGIHIAIMYPISSDNNKKLSKDDKYGGIVFGITPILRISKKTSIFVDVSSFNNYGQNLTWNGKHSSVSNNAEGHMYSGTFGLSFALDNTKK